MSARLYEYETVIGLEVHVELGTATKMFCSCPNAFGASPNTLCCPVCAGLPGGVPSMNRQAIEKAITAGLALHCEIAPVSRMDRKQYVYPDLPKAYQISQNEYPICKNGYLDIRVNEGKKRIGITRIHIEEDAGKLIHTSKGTLIDYNRCGVGLIEIVSDPDLRSAEEAVAYLRELRSILIACGVSDCKMQEGAFRCDVNLSIRPKGSDGMGVRTEIKNLNSFSFAEKAIGAESQRQQEELEQSGVILQRTVRFLPATGKTEPMRAKETSADYRFFPEPNLPPVLVDAETLRRLKRDLPELPDARRARLKSSYGITFEDACVLTATTGLADYFEAAAEHSEFPLQVCNLLLNDLLRYCTDEPFATPVKPKRLGEVATLFGAGEINFATAKQLLGRLLQSDFSPREIAQAEGLTRINDEKVIRAWVMETIAENGKAVEDYRGGRTHAKKALQGILMGKSRGRANPILADRLLSEQLDGEFGGMKDV